MKGTEIIAIRKSLLMTQAIFSQVIGATPVTISKWEKSRSQPSAYFESLLLTFKTAQRNNMDVGIRAVQEVVQGNPIKALYVILKAAFTK